MAQSEIEVRKIVDEMMLRSLLKEKYTIADLGLKLRALPDAKALSLESDSAVISDAIADKAKAAAKLLSSRIAPVMTYLANGIRINGKERILTPIENTWDSFFLSEEKVTDDFLTERAIQIESNRESF